MTLSVLLYATADWLLPLAQIKVMQTAAAPPAQIVLVLDGFWPAVPLPSDARVVILHFGSVIGRPAALRLAARAATGDTLLRFEDWQQYGSDLGSLPSNPQPREQTVTGDPRQVWAEGPGALAGAGAAPPGR